MVRRDLLARLSHAKNSSQRPPLRGPRVGCRSEKRDWPTTTGRGGRESRLWAMSDHAIASSATKKLDLNRGRGRFP
jgi:hypothetical protein